MAAEFPEADLYALTHNEKSGLRCPSPVCTAVVQRSQALSSRPLPLMPLACRSLRIGVEYDAVVTSSLAFPASSRFVTLFIFRTFTHHFATGGCQGPMAVVRLPYSVGPEQRFGRWIVDLPMERLRSLRYRPRSNDEFVRSTTERPPSSFQPSMLDISRTPRQLTTSTNRPVMCLGSRGGFVTSASTW